MLYVGNTKSKVYLGSQKIKHIYVGNNKIYSSGNICTYVCNGVNYRVEIDEGAECITTDPFMPLEDADFLGWSDNLDSTETLTTLVMGDNPITLYAVFKYKDKQQALSRTQYTDGGADVWSNAFNVDWTNNFDISKYAGLSVHIDGNMTVNYEGTTLNCHIKAGGGDTVFFSPYRRNGQDKKSQAFSGTYSLNFTKTTGNTKLQTVVDGGSSTVRGVFNMSTLMLIGKKVVG